MASQDKIVEIIFGIKTIYPYYAKETDVESLVKTWGLLLQDIPDEVADAAFYKALRVCKVPPTPADIIEQVNAMHAATLPSPEELWTVYHEAIRETMRLIPQFNYTYVDASGMSQGQQAREKVEKIWDRLPETIKGYLVSRGELIRTAQQIMVSTEGDVAWEKQRFLKQVPILEKRAQDNTFMLTAQNLKMITGG